MKPPFEWALRPFQVPNYVVAECPQDGPWGAIGFALKDIDAEALAQLCNEFRAAVFAKAGKADPDADE